jgi:hypothetical protein
MSLELDAINLSTATQADLGLSGMEFQNAGLGQVQPDGSLQLAGDFGWVTMLDQNGDPLGILKTPDPGYDFGKNGLPPGSSVQSWGNGQFVVHDAYGHEIGWINANPMNGDFPDPWGTVQAIGVNGGVTPDGSFAMFTDPAQVLTYTVPPGAAAWTYQGATPVSTGVFDDRG